MQDAGLVNPEEISARGLMWSDRKAGPFKLEVESIKVMRTAR